MTSRGVVYLILGIQIGLGIAMVIALLALKFGS